MRTKSSVSAILAFVVSFSDWVQVAITTCTNPESLTSWNTKLGDQLWQLMVITSCARQRETRGVELSVSSSTVVR